MAVRYTQTTEKFRSDCSVSLPEELKEKLERWKINLTVISQNMGMKRPTLGNKIKGNLGTSFSVDEYYDFINVLKKMVDDFEPFLSKYPKLDE